MTATEAKLRFPQGQSPQLPLPNPERGRYHAVRFVRSNAMFNLGGEEFLMPPETVYEYVRATVDVTQQKLRFHLARRTIDEQTYTIR